MTESRKIRVLLVNSYSFDPIFINWQNGENPSHFLMGKIELEESGDFVVDILEHQKFVWLNKLGNILQIPYLDQQIRALFRVRNYDLLYFPYPLANCRLISLFKWIGLLSTPVVVLGHQGFLFYDDKKSLLGKIFKKSFQQFDHYAFFSKRLLEKTRVDLGFSMDYASKHFHHVHWGPDRKFYRSLNHFDLEPSPPFAISAGTVDRDYDMLIDAFSQIKQPLKIFCTPKGVSSTKILPENVTVDNSWVPYPQLLKEYLASSFIIIPIREDIKNRGNTFGLTVLNDCIALGKPVLMTYHPYIDIDIEKENIGLWVKDNTVKGWTQALNKMFGLSDQFHKMGESARDLYFEKYNSGVFSNELAEIFRKAL